MNTEENVMPWNDFSAKITCGHCGEVIAFYKEENQEHRKPEILLKFKKEITNRVPLWSYNNIPPSEPSIHIIHVKQHDVRGRCWCCNRPTEISYATPCRELHTSDAPTLERRWKENGLQLLCNCGEQLAFIDPMSEEELKKRRRYLEEYKQLNKDGSRRITWTENDATLWKDNLDHFVPAENRTFFPAWLEWCKKEQHDPYTPIDYDWDIFEPVIPHLAHYHLTVRLRFSKRFWEDIEGWSYNRHKLGTYIPACTKS